MTVTYDQECVDRLIAEAIEKERKEFAIHAVDIARRAIAEGEERERNRICKQLAALHDSLSLASRGKL